MDQPTLILIILLTLLTLPPYLMSIRALLPLFDQEVQGILRRSPGRSFWIGLVNVIFWGAAIAVFGALTDGGSPIFGIPAVLLLGAVAIGLSIGLGAISQIIGETWFGHQNSGRQAIWGSILLTLGSLLPFLGWFLLFPLVATAGLGATFMNLLVRFQPEPVKTEKTDP